MSAWFQQTALWSWQNSLAAGVLAALLLVTVRFGRGRIEPRWLYVAGWLIMVRLFLPAPFANPWAWDRAWVEKTAAAENSGETAKALLAEIAAARGELLSLRAKTAQQAPADAASGTSPNGTILTPEVGTTVQPPSVDWLPVAIWIWAAGAALYFLFCIRQHRCVLRRLSAAGLSSPAAGVQAVLKECSRLAGLRRIPRLLTVSGSGSPFLFGLLRPCIVLPADTLAALSTAELRHVLLHEMLHIARRDLAANWLLAAARALHWWNPFVHFAARRLLADREVLRDRQAIALLQEPDASAAYGHTLLKIATPFAAPSLSPGLAPFFRTEKELKRRLTMIQSPIPRRRLTACAAAGALACISVPLFTTARGHEKTVPQTEPDRNVQYSGKSEPKAPPQSDAASARAGESARMEAAKLGVQLDSLKTLEGDDLLRGVLILGESPPTIEKLYPEYQQALVTGRELLRSGFGRKHPKVAGLQTSADVMHNQLIESAEHFRKALEVRYAAAKAMASAASPSAEPALANLRALAKSLRDKGQNEDAAAIEKELEALAAATAESTPPPAPATDVEKLRAELAEVKAAIAQLREQSGAREDLLKLGASEDLLKLGRLRMERSGNEAAGERVETRENLALKKRIADLEIELVKRAAQSEALRSEAEMKGRKALAQQQEADKAAEAARKAYAEKRAASADAKNREALSTGELEEMKKAIADLSRASGADELRKELARLKDDRQWLEGKKAAEMDKRLAEIEKVLAERTSQLLQQKEQLLLETERERARVKEAEMRAQALQNEAAAMKRKLMDEDAAKRKAEEARDAEMRARAEAEALKKKQQLLDEEKKRQDADAAKRKEAESSPPSDQPRSR